MPTHNSIPQLLIAPCGMNCAVCSRYLAHVHGLKRSKCTGCRPRNERCTYLFEKCDGINRRAKGDAVFCFRCASYPCSRIDRMDERYQKNFNMSIKENLERIRTIGIRKFIREQYRKHRCPDCGGLISVHNGKCFQCDTITRLVEISGRRSGKKTGR